MPLDGHHPDATLVRDREALLDEAFEIAQAPPSSSPSPSPGEFHVSREVTIRETRTHLVSAETPEDAIADLRDFYLYGAEPTQAPPRLLRVETESDAADPVFEAKPAIGFHAPDYRIMAQGMREDVRQAGESLIRDLADDEALLAALPPDIRIRLVLVRRLLTLSGMDPFPAEADEATIEGILTGDPPEPECPPSPPPPFQNWP